MKRSIISFKCISDRVSYLKLRIQGGKATFFNAYAPHAGYEYGVRQLFFSSLQQTISSGGSFGMKMLVGDLNARIHNSAGGQNHVFGPHCFGNPGYKASQYPDSNRELQLELCISLGFCVANTFLQSDPHKQIAYHELWSLPVAEVSHRNFAQLDHLATFDPSF